MMCCSLYDRQSVSSAPACLQILSAKSLSRCACRQGTTAACVDCILRDSASYLDHINGKYHNRALGMSMRVERSTADQVG